MKRVTGNIFSLSVPTPQPTPETNNDTDLYELSHSGNLVTNRIPTDPFNRIVLSWRISGQGQVWVSLSIRIDGNWTPFCAMGYRNTGGCWYSKSISSEGYRVIEDQFILDEGIVADGFQVSITFHRTGPEVTNLGVSHWHQSEGFPPVGPLALMELSTVPALSQFDPDVIGPSDFPQYLGDDPVNAVTCNLVSAAMLIGSTTAESVSLAEIGDLLFDHTTGGFGNWSFTTNAIASIADASVYIGHIDSLPTLAQEIYAGRAVVVSIAWEVGELTNAPIPSSNGHLVVVCGFTLKDGQQFVIVNDPAGQPGEVRREYLATEFSDIWQRHGGVAYIYELPEKTK